MLNVLIRAIILYFFLLAAMRLMGKRQLSEFQPFEFAITLVAADLACIPMSDNTIPIIYGIIPIFTLVILHNLLTFFAIKSHRFRKLINGKPVILIGDGKIDCGSNNLPYNVVVEGRFMGDTFKSITPPLEKDVVVKTLEKENMTIRDVFLFSIDKDAAFIQSYDGRVVNTIIEK